MKKILYFLSFVFVALFTACSEGDDFDIDYTPIAPIGGQYRINVERGYDASKTDAEYWASNPTDAEFIFKTDGTGTTSGVLYAYLSNTTDYDKDKAWIRVGSTASKAPSMLRYLLI